MKNAHQVQILAFLYLALLCPVYTFGEDAAIVDLRKKYNQIEAAKLAPNTINFSFEYDPAEGKVTFWEENGQVRKIVLESGSEHGGSTESFYYWEGKLFFVFKADSMWRFSGNTLPNGQSETVDTLKEMRFYFNNGTCIRALSREAKHTNAAILGKEIAKLANQPFSDAGVISETGEKGVAIFGMKKVFY